MYVTLPRPEGRLGEETKHVRKALVNQSANASLRAVSLQPTRAGADKDTLLLEMQWPETNLAFFFKDFLLSFLCCEFPVR